MLATVLGFALVVSALMVPTTTSAQKDEVVATSLAPTATFPGAGVGPIPDLATGCQPTQGAPLNVVFNVTGISGPPTDVNVSITFGGPNHSWAGDVTATLFAPNGTSHPIFGRLLATTATAAGDNSDLGGVYNFDNTVVTAGFWQAATAQTSATLPIAPDTYRTTNPGGAGAVNPQPPTDINAAFAGIPTSNGTWTLRLTDGCAADTGAVSAASLTLTGAAAPADANADYNGDGKTDFIVARGTNTPLADGVNSPILGVDQEVKGRRSTATSNVSPTAPPIYWYTSINGSGVTSVQSLGDAATDFIVTEDFDGDGRDDIAVWREAPATQAAFYILRSSSGTIDVQLFGQTGDDPAVVGDYDGDNKADVAVYRCPGIAAPDGQCYFFYRGTNANPGGNVTYVPWGFGVEGDFFPYVGDFDGDGKNDFCIQRTNPSAPTQGQFVLLKSNGFGVEFINWGNSSDFLIPGDYDGDGKTDLCVRRTVSGARQHWILTRTGATSFTVWGVTGDSSVPGDYDGDGKTDLAIWRPSTDSAANFFWVLNSSNGAVSQTEWGQCPTVGTCDFAVAGWAVH